MANDNVSFRPGDSPFECYSRGLLRGSITGFDAGYNAAASNKCDPRDAPRQPVHQSPRSSSSMYPQAAARKQLLRRPQHLQSPSGRSTPVLQEEPNPQPPEDFLWWRTGHGWVPYKLEHQHELMAAWDAIFDESGEQKGCTVVHLKDGDWTYHVNLGMLTEPSMGYSDVVGWQTAENEHGEINRRRWVRLLHADNTDFMVTENPEECAPDCKPKAA